MSDAITNAVATRPDPALFLASLPGALLAVDPANMVAYANDACEAFLGRSRARIEGRTIDSVLRFQLRRLNVALTDREENISAQSVTLEHRDGTESLIDMVIAPLIGQPGWRIISITPRTGERDYINSEAKAGEQAALGAPAVLGHEIKNPLAGIKGAAQLLQRQVAEAERPLTDLIIAEVDRIARIIDQMQHLGARSPMAVQPVNIHALLNRALQSIRGANKQVPDIKINFDPSLPDVLVDPDALLQVLINLLQNAVDALRETAAPQIVITTRFVMGGALKRPDNDDGVARPIKLPVEVAVSDNGPGVPQHIRADLFSPFVTTKRDGQGLGLAIVRKLMRDMNARVVHERDPSDSWTHFRLLLPIAEGHAA